MEHLEKWHSAEIVGIFKCNFTFCVIFSFISEGVNILFWSAKWAYSLTTHTPSVGDVFKSFTEGVWNSNRIAQFNKQDFTCNHKISLFQFFFLIFFFKHFQIFLFQIPAIDDATQACRMLSILIYKKQTNKQINERKCLSSCSSEY